MYKGHRIGVVVPAFNEQELILETLGGMPDYVDQIFFIDDCSTDNTYELVLKRQKEDCRIRIIAHEVNMGLGKSLVDGYVASKETDIDITVVMAGDNQMHPHDLPNLLDAIIDSGYDYAKGNRLLHANIHSMPTYRFLGNSILTILTKFATGYYRLMDPQCGYTAIRNIVLKRIPIQSMTRGYGYNADILCMLNIQRFRVADIEVRPVYDREKSKIKIWKYIPKTSWILTKLFFYRLWHRYIVLDFHPLVLFYLFAFLNTILLIVPFSLRLVYLWSKYGEFPSNTMTIVIFSILMTFQSILFAIWMDMDYNKNS